jgi:hypothetical protein
MRTAALFSLILAALPAAAAAKPPTVLVELYTAQGCRTCAEANGLVGKLAERPGVLPLTFSVDYWDYLGWTDTFAKPEFTQRQKAYVARLRLREPYTPQVVVDGRGEAGGLKSGEVEALLKTAQSQPGDPPQIRFVGASRVDVGQGHAPKGGADVWLIRYDPRDAEVAVKRGDNRGETVIEKNVVHEIRRLGLWRGKPKAYRLGEAGEEGLKSVVVVQTPKGGRVIGVAEKG